MEVRTKALYKEFYFYFICMFTFVFPTLWLPLHCFGICMYVSIWCVFLMYYLATFSCIAHKIGHSYFYILFYISTCYTFCVWLDICMFVFVRFSCLYRHVCSWIGIMYFIVHYCSILYVIPLHTILYVFLVVTCMFGFVRFP